MWGQLLRWFFFHETLFQCKGKVPFRVRFKWNCLTLPPAPVMVDVYTDLQGLNTSDSAQCLHGLRCRIKLWRLCRLVDPTGSACKIKWMINIWQTFQPYVAQMLSTTSACFHYILTFVFRWPFISLLDRTEGSSVRNDLGDFGFSSLIKPMKLLPSYWVTVKNRHFILVCNKKFQNQGNCFEPSPPTSFRMNYTDTVEMRPLSRFLVKQRYRNEKEFLVWG